jgi:hypothetical protein
MSTRRRFGVAVLGVLAVLLGGTGRADASFITWGAAQGISGNSDVDTTGTLVGAFNLGNVAITSPPVPAVMDTTVNGVTFAGLAIPSLSSAPVTSGNFTFALVPVPGIMGVGFLSANGDTSTNPPFANLTAPYQALLSSFAGGQKFGGNGGDNFPLTLTMSGLTVGHKYEFEWWSNHTGDSVQTFTTAMAGNSVQLNSNVQGLMGGVGQFAIGTFTADMTSEQITFTGFSPNGGSKLNGLQLRDLGPAVSAVPEPASVTLATLGALGLLGYGWRKRRMMMTGGRAA